MKKFFKNFLFIPIIFSSNNICCQVDPHFSQNYVYPHYLNPANTGIIQSDYSVTAIYRNQWPSITTPFSTAAGSVDFRGKNKANYGLNILNQTAGNGGYNLLNLYGSLAFTGLRFGEEGSKHIVIGLQIGFLGRRIDPSKFQLGDQWNSITGYSGANPTSDHFTTVSSGVFDAGAGVLYYDDNAYKKANVFAGAAVFN